MVEAKKTGNSTQKSPKPGASDALSARLSGPLAPLEKKLNELLVKKAPVQIPPAGREAIAKYSPWISLLAGLFGLFAALALWRAAHTVNELVEFANRISASVGAESTVAKLGVAFWLSLGALVLFSVLALVAVPALKARKKTGWNLAFYSVLANLLYGVFALFYDGAGFGSFISAAIGTLLSLYVLFQVRSYFKS